MRLIAGSARAESGAARTWTWPFPLDWVGGRQGSLGAKLFRLFAVLVLISVANGDMVDIESSSALSVASMGRRLRAERQPEHEWMLHGDKHWQIVSPDFEDPAITDAIEQDRGSCPVGMIEVQGQSKTAFGRAYSIETLQSLTCLDWVSQSFPERCAAFDEPKYGSLIAEFPTVSMTFCIDRYEYPNVKGQYPWVLVTWTEATDICAEEGKRLCSEDEWTFACEGEQALPYPYGYARSSEACVIDRPWKDYDDRAWADRSSRSAMLELDHLWQGEPSGSRAACRSPYGVYDMTGNVDEWTSSTDGRGYRSILKGGYWAEVRNRCRPSTRAHGETFAYYQQGFRCCADVP